MNWAFQRYGLPALATALVLHMIIGVWLFGGAPKPVAIPIERSFVVALGASRPKPQTPQSEPAKQQTPAQRAPESSGGKTGIPSVRKAKRVATEPSATGGSPSVVPDDGDRPAPAPRRKPQRQVAEQKEPEATQSKEDAPEGESPFDFSVPVLTDTVGGGRADSVGDGNEVVRIAGYADLVTRWLKQYLRYPAVAQRRGQQGVTVLEMDVARDGRVRRFRILKSSGYVLLDRAVERMVLHASPLPPPPSRMKPAQRRITIPVQFVLNGR